MLRKIDLHMHSTVSDGSDTPEEILAHVKAAGIDFFSLTDHDAIMGAMTIKTLLAESKEEEQPDFITGAEFSCRDSYGRYHILAYDYDPSQPAIRALVEKGHAIRMKKVQARLDFLKDEFGFVFSEEDLQTLLSRKNPGKPHIGNLMVKYGYAKTKEEAIKSYIDQLHLKDDYLHPKETIEAIIEADAIPVLAHPLYGSGDQLIMGKEMEARLRYLIDFGLQGVEAYYSGFSQKMIEQMLSFAAQFDLYVTAGSDYHGKNKLVTLGDTNLADVKDGPPALHRFLRVIAERRAK